MTQKNTDIAQLINGFSNKHIVVLGDTMLDEFHWCKVSRISPEAPVPICKLQRTSLALGGAGNVAYNLAKLGAKVSLCGLIGNDSSGEKLLHLVQDLGINASGLIKTPYPTILKSRIIAHQQHVVRLDRDGNNAISIKYRHAIYTYLTSIISTCNAIVISDYLKGLLSPSFTQRIITLAKKHQCIVITDPKGDSYAKYKGSNIITPNFKEFCEVTKKVWDKEKDIEKAGKQLVKRLHLDSLLITRSEKGMSIVTPSSFTTIHTKAKDVFDITGAGDTVIALLALSIASGLSYDVASLLANYAAGIVVGKVGTAAVSPDELQRALEYDDVTLR